MRRVSPAEMGVGWPLVAECYASGRDVSQGGIPQSAMRLHRRRLVPGRTSSAGSVWAGLGTADGHTPFWPRGFEIPHITTVGIVGADGVLIARASQGVIDQIALATAGTKLGTVGHRGTS